jgi:ribose transport system permease protein
MKTSAILKNNDVSQKMKTSAILKNKDASQKLIIVGALILLVIFFSIMNKSYVSYDNIMTILLATCVNGLLAIGVSFVIITGGIDISVGTIMTFSCVMSGTAFTVWGWPIWLAILFGFFIGALCGAINGFAVTKMMLPPFIATMAMMMITKGLSLVISGIKPVYFTKAANYQKIAIGEFLGIKGFYNAIIILIVIGILAHILFSRTLIGRYDLAIGSNEEAARLSGINVVKWKISIYSLCGLFCGVAGLIMSSRLNSAQPQLGAGYELEAIAAAVIGGNSLNGGEGSIVGTMIGALIISSLTNGLRIMAVSTEIQSAIVGLVLALAVFLDQMRKKKGN